ncbi:unnamed protein product, partial [Aureobasidium uvarum]
DDPNAGVTCDGSDPLLLSNIIMDEQRPWSRSGINPHARSMSERKAKRFSLTFPIQTSVSPTSAILSPVLPYTPLLAEKPTLAAGPTDSAFLTALAAHERRVLELREELIKAEHELHRLKQTWAAHEAHKKRQHDPRKVHKMQSLHATPDTDPLLASRQHDMERRRALLSSNKNSTRTVFSGSRHARALSLLSPDAMRPPPPRSQPQPRTEQDSSRPPHPTRVPTDADLTTEVARTADDAIDLGLPREVLLKTGKQMASDFRDGLWTFIEDLRQATVGDEGINGTTSRTQSRSPNPSRSPRPQPSRGSLKPSPNPQPLKRSATTGSRRTDSRSPAPSAAEEIAYLDIGNSFWKEHESTPAPILRKPSKKKSVPPPVKVNRASTTSLDAWENWEATVPSSDPKPSRSNSSISELHTSSSPDDTSPTTSTSSSRDTKRDSLPWPALNKLAPSNLRRTASHLMNEWERSLSPTSGDTDRQGDYLERAISPAGSFKETKND